LEFDDSADVRFERIGIIETIGFVRRERIPNAAIERLPSERVMHAARHLRLAGQHNEPGVHPARSLARPLSASTHARAAELQLADVAQSR
jgi:hypothetical protein